MELSCDVAMKAPELRPRETELLMYSSVDQREMLLQWQNVIFRTEQMTNRIRTLIIHIHSAI
jgi:hypothetical protein